MDKISANHSANLSEEDRIAIQTIIMEQLNVSLSQVAPEARITDDLNADSLDIIEITMKLEELFALAIPDARAEKIQTVSDIYDTVADIREQAK
jgi:acyl carrier protein